MERLQLHSQERPRWRHSDTPDRADYEAIAATKPLLLHIVVAAQSNTRKTHFAHLTAGREAVSGQPTGKHEGSKLFKATPPRRKTTSRTMLIAQPDGLDFHLKRLLRG